jgi:phosphonate transport system permease protein
VPAPIAALLSLILPGLGQILGRHIRRGVLIFASFFTVGGLFVWRVVTANRLGRETTSLVGALEKAYRVDPFLIFVTIMVILLYFWIAYDAYRLVNAQGAQSVAIFVIIIVVFFVLGWQIGEIDLVKLFTQADEAVPALSRLMWPWTRAITYPEDVLTASAEILSPCTDEPFTQTTPESGEPYLVTTPTCGEPSEDVDNPGTVFAVQGFGLKPNTETEIWWDDPIGNEFRQRQEGEYVKVTTDDQGSFEVQIVMPYRLLPPSAGEGPKIWTLEARQFTATGEWEFSEELKLSIEKMVETIIIGMMATFFGILFSVPVSFLAARNLMSGSILTLIIYYLTRGVLNIVRSIEPLIWAIIAVIVVGLGPYAGILALTLHSIAALGKLYSEAIESIDPGPIEAIQATGANWVQTVFFAVIPQIIPPFVSFTIYRWDINIRMSTIIGFVGGGGIGFLLSQWIRLLDYSAAGIAVWFIAITVAILDYISAEIRARYV